MQKKQDLVQGDNHVIVSCVFLEVTEMYSFEFYQLQKLFYNFINYFNEWSWFEMLCFLKNLAYSPNTFFTYANIQLTVMPERLPDEF